MICQVNEHTLSKVTSDVTPQGITLKFIRVVAITAHSEGGDEAENLCRHKLNPRSCEFLLVEENTQAGRKRVSSPTRIVSSITVHL